MIQPVKILILEDDKSDADLLCRELKKSGLSFISEIVQTRLSFEQSLEDFRPDLIVSDYALPAFDAITAFRIKQTKYPLIPFIIVSGIIGEENAVELIKEGVTDYAPKGKLFSLPVKIIRALNDAAEKRKIVLINQEKELRAVELLNLSDSLRRANELLLIQDAKVQSINEELEIRVIARTKALTESEHRFRNMMETIPQIAWTNTLDGKFIFYNQRWFDYTGAQGLLWAAIHPDDLKKSLAWFRQIRQKAEGGESQLRIKRSDGFYRWHLIRIMPIKDEYGAMQLWVGTATDIEELRLLQQQKDDFISIASHELKTPLTSLKGALQILDRMKENPSPKMIPMIIQANKSLNKVNILVADLLYASKLNQGQLHIEPKNIVLANVISDSCQYIRAEGFYDVQIDGNLQIQVFADSTRIDQVVTNFITNAIKYAPESKNIVIYIEQIKGMAQVSVTDTGPGIPVAKQRFLFDRYYRADNSGSQYTGLGLGLYICAEIIKVHHGKIGVVSEPGKGSTFWFTLPMA